MEQLILNIKQKDKLPFLRELLDKFDFVEIVDNTTPKTKRKKETLEGIESSVRFIEEFEKGKVKAKPFQDLLNEL